MSKELKTKTGQSVLVDLIDYTKYQTTKLHLSNGYVATSRREYLHRLIMEATKNQVVDHVDGNKLNNRRENLRICTQSQNMANWKKTKKKSSRYRGVYWYKASKKWAAHIIYNRKKSFLGYFMLESDAALAYNKAATHFFGEFASLNRIGE